MGTLGLWILAAALGVMVYRRQGTVAFRLAMADAGLQAVSILPRIVAAVLTAGFVGLLLPTGALAHHMGPNSGLGGILLAMAVGSVIPAGPIIAFPLVVVMYDAGVGMAQLITLLTSWSVFAVHRVLTFEIPLMGGRFAALRFVSSLPLPLIAGGLTVLALRL